MALGSGMSLGERLTGVLPEGCRFTIHHLSTPPTQSRPLYAAPPDELAEETYCESHFLSVSIDSDGQQLQVFGIEVLIYSTEYLTTLFVSKADSTGYLYLLKSPAGTPSPLRIVSTTFLDYLVNGRRRSDRRLVLSLFARAQNQYLFPGSIENSHKHVLDDRGLIRWWCKVVDPLLSAYQNVTEYKSNEHQGTSKVGSGVKSRGYLKVPGCDLHETRNFLPKDGHGHIDKDHRWHASDPLTELGRSSSLPERCLIPRFPDDPKARFVEQLDDELPDDDCQSQSQSQSHIQHSGRWRSVKSLAEFWDMMSFRQECSSGRLVGFLWATFQPCGPVLVGKAVDEEERSRNPPQTALPTPDISQHQDPAILPPQSPLRSSPPPEIPSTPSKPSLAATQQTPTPTPQKTKEAILQSQPEESKYYYWPTSSRGEVVIRQKDYERAGKLLLRLDYADQEIARDSTKKWINDVAERAGVQDWGRPVVGTIPITRKVAEIGVDANPMMLNAGLIRKKKRPIEEVIGHAAMVHGDAKEPDVTILSTEPLEKQAKVAKRAASLIEKANGTSAPG